MRQESRTVKSVLNIKVALLFYILNLILQFFSRKVFLDYLGSEVLGLNTTAQNLLGFLNLAELGIGAAVAYNLYKPLYNKDIKTINAIVTIQGWLYRRIAFIVILGACVIMCFFPFIFAKANVPLWYAYGSFIVFLFSSLLSYFVNYQQVVLSADQKEYKVTLVVQGIKIIKVVLQILAIIFFLNGYLWWMLIEVVMAFLTSYRLNQTIRKEYPWLLPKISEGKKLRKEYPQVLLKTKQIFYHKIGGFALTQTSPLIIYAYASLTLVAIYGNYMLIVSGVTLLISALLNGIYAAVGNLVAEGDKTHIKDVFWELTSLRMWLASIICFGIYVLADSFISLWVGSQYILPHSSLLLLVCITFINLSRTNDAFIAAYGLYQDIWAPIVEATLNIGLSILFGYFWGLSGILLGVLVSLLVVVYSWKPYFLYKYGFKESITEYLKRYMKYFILYFISVVLSLFVINKLVLIQLSSYISWGIYSVVVVSVYAFISLFLLYIADIGARRFVYRFFKILHL